MTSPAPTLTPEANYISLARGVGEEFVVANGAAWQAQSVSNQTHAGMSQVNTAATQMTWTGLSSVASSASATTLNGVLEAMGAWTQVAVPITESAALAYRAAVMAMFPDVVCAENRVEQAKDVAINPLVWGALTPDIVRLDTTYFGPYWTVNASQVMAYSALLLGFLATLAVPPPLGPPSVSPAGPAGAAEAVAQATAQGVAGDAMRESATSGMSTVEQMGSSSGMGAAQQFMEPVMSGVQQAAQVPQQAMQSLSEPLNSAMQPLQSVMGMFSQSNMAGSAIAPTAATAESVSAFGSTAAGGAGTGGGAVSAGSGYVPGAGYGGAGLTNYTRPTSSFAPEPSGGAASYAKPSAVRPVGATGAPVSGGMPMAPGMLGRSGKESEKDNETRTARLAI